MSTIESLVCPHCGADLDVPDGVSILKCRFCGSKLQLRETGSVRALALIERGLEAIGDNTAKAAAGIDNLLKHQQKLRAEAHKKWLKKLRELEAVADAGRLKLGKNAARIRDEARKKEQAWGLRHWWVSVELMGAIVGAVVLATLHVQNKLPETSSGGLMGAMVGGAIFGLVPATLGAVAVHSWAARKAERIGTTISALELERAELLAYVAELDAKVDRWREREPL